MKKSIILIGGHSKGFVNPFDERTLSGKRIRKIVAELGLTQRVGYLDLWRNAEEEKKGFIEPLVRGLLSRLFEAGSHILIPLGKYVERRLKEAGFHLLALPHPASRRKKDLVTLKKGLKKRAEEN